jgi:predicted Fe-Mo cluster-binding NifX family protein
MPKIAFPTEDGQSISAHFGRAPYFMVVTLDGTAEVKSEQRSKTYHGSDDHAQHDQHSHNHGGMLAPIADCQVLIAGGMGQPAYDSATAAGLTVILTGEKSIAMALAAYRTNTLISDMRRVHAAH